MSSAESHLGLLRKGCLRVNFVFFFGAQKEVSSLCLLYTVLLHSIHEYLYPFVAARYARTSAVLGELDFMFPRC